MLRNGAARLSNRNCNRHRGLGGDPPPPRDPLLLPPLLPLPLQFRALAPGLCNRPSRSNRILPTPTAAATVCNRRSCPATAVPTVANRFHRRPPHWPVPPLSRSAGQPSPCPEPVPTPPPFNLPDRSPSRPHAPIPCSLPHYPRLPPPQTQAHPVRVRQSLPCPSPCRVPLQILIKLGPTFIKAGQVLANRPDIIRMDYMQELTLLQDNVPAFPNAEAMAIMEQQIGAPLDTVFSYVSTDPIAAASLGQVARRSAALPALPRALLPEWGCTSIALPCSRWAGLRWAGFTTCPPPPPPGARSLSLRSIRRHATARWGAFRTIGVNPRARTLDPGVFGSVRRRWLYSRPGSSGTFKSWWHVLTPRPTCRSVSACDSALKLPSSLSHLIRSAR